jgi:hypothetical protein
MPRKGLRLHFFGLPARSGELFVNFLELPLQYFRRHVRLSEWKIPRKDDPEDRHAIEDHVHVQVTLRGFEELAVEDRVRVRATLRDRDFEELADLPDEVREQLVADLVIAIWAWRAGVKPGKRGLSDEKEAQHIFFSDVGRALGRVGQRAARWRKTYDGDGGPDPDAPESFYFRLVRALGDDFGIPIPKDLMLATKRASEIQYEMSPALKAAQDAELAARGRQRLDGLAARLKTCATQGTVTPETVYADLPLELRFLALGLSSAKTLAGSPLA